MLEDPDDPLEKPLPSVDMPLLREERQATKAKRTAGIVVLGLAVVGGLMAALGARVLDKPKPEDDLPNLPSAATAPATTTLATAVVDGGLGDALALVQSPYTPTALTTLENGNPEDDAKEIGTTALAPSRTKSNFGKSRGFRSALVSAGASEGDCSALERALDGVLDFRRCRPTDQLVFERDEHGTLVRFEYHPGPTQYYEAVRNADDVFEARKVDVPVDTVRLARGGGVKVSLGEALSTQGLGRALVGVFVEVFDQQINFTTDTREGDKFRVTVDEERIDGQFLQYGVAHAIEYQSARKGLLRAFWFEPRKGEGDYFDESGRSIAGGWLRTPCRYDRISSRYNPRRVHPILKRIVPHNGVDYAAGTGTPVWAAAAGTISFAGKKGANGNLVSIKHARGYESAYAHLHRIKRGIKTGTQVRQRQIIGYVGSTGRSTGPHLHFGLKRAGRWVDPMVVLNGPGRMMANAALPRYRRHVRQMLSQLSRIPIPTGGGTSGAQLEGVKEVAQADSPMD